jgi:RHS repeat-associated protein
VPRAACLPVLASNQLTSLSGPGVTAAFQYDARGRRDNKVVNGTNTDFNFDGLTVVQEKNGTVVKANLLTGLGIDETFGRTEGTVNNWFLPDGLGSTLGITDANGVLQTQYTYDPFGSTTVTGAASTNSFEFTGRENDGTGLYYYRARYYQPGLQRFIGEDPSGFAGNDANLYAYVTNDPVNFIDSTGFGKGGPRNIEPSPGDSLGDRIREIKNNKNLSLPEKNKLLKALGKDIEQLPAGPRKKILEGFLKVTSRGGKMGFLIGIGIELGFPDEAGANDDMLGPNGEPPDDSSSDDPSETEDEDPSSSSDTCR